MILERGANMKDTLWIVDKKKYINELEYLKTNLNITNILYEKDCDTNSLLQYKIVSFLINPDNTGNKFFLERIKEILKIRPHSSSLLFLINDSEKLERQEMVKLKTEIIDSLRGLIKTPKVLFFSTFFANLYYKYNKVKINCLGLYLIIICDESNHKFHHIRIHLKKINY